MDTARDLACADVWQASLERSLARRGKPTRSSLELFHLRPERDLSCVDILRESTAFSEMRRSAAARRPAMSLPGAGGISALALLAAATLPGLIGGRGSSARAARITASTAIVNAAYVIHCNAFGCPLGEDSLWLSASADLVRELSDIG